MNSISQETLEQILHLEMSVKIVEISISRFWSKAVNVICDSVTRYLVKYFNLQNITIFTFLYPV